MVREVQITLHMPARVHAKLLRRAASAGLSVETAILRSIARDSARFETADTQVFVATRPGQLWADEWSSRWGELSAPHRSSATEV